MKCFSISSSIKKQGFSASYLLADSWFFSSELWGISLKELAAKAQNGGEVSHKHKRNIISLRMPFIPATESLSPLRKDESGKINYFKNTVHFGTKF